MFIAYVYAEQVAGVFMDIFLSFAQTAVPVRLKTTSSGTSAKIFITSVPRWLSPYGTYS